MELHETERPPSPEVRRTEQTIFEGKVDYRARWSFWEREGAEVDKRHWIFFPDSQTFDWQDKRPMWSLENIDGEQRLWDELGEIWAWLERHAQMDIRGYQQYFYERPGKGWPTMAQYARRIAEGKAPYGTCFTTAHLLANLWHHCGLSPYRHAIAGASHNITRGLDPHHWYCALWIAGAWRPIDPSFIASRHWPPEPKAIAGWGSRVDYAHPDQVIPVPGGPDFVPLVRA